jgi:p-hydroxybenzoate 3-monooxygenase
MKTQVCIIGGGPSGLLLGQRLHKAGIGSIIIERATKDRVLARIRAGVLERGTVAQLEDIGCADRLHAEGHIHDGTILSTGQDHFRIDFKDLTGTSVIVYGQTEVTRDLYDARDEAGLETLYSVEDVTLHAFDSAAPFVTFTHEGGEKRIDCDFIAGCDGFHGVSRAAIPGDKLETFEQIYPFGWLGILSRTPPVHHELIYTHSKRGFALCSMRNEALSRYYIQCALSDHVEDWSDEAFWTELKRRLPGEYADALVTGPSIEKSIAPLRSFVTEPMQWQRLFLCGDAAHIVPPTGAKGLNLAASDVHYLFEGLEAFYTSRDRSLLDGYSTRALARVWKAERFSWWFSSLTHRYPDQSPFELRMQKAELDFLRSNRAAQVAMAENYVGLPY